MGQHTFIAMLLLVLFAMQSCSSEDPVEKRKQQVQQLRQNKSSRPKSQPCDTIAKIDTVIVTQVDTVIVTKRDTVKVQPQCKTEVKYVTVTQTEKSKPVTKHTDVKPRITVPLFVKVKAKDTYYSIAKQYNKQPKALMRLNANKPLKIGESIRIE